MLPDEKPGQPKNAFELMTALGVKPDEGVQVAVFPDKVEEVALTGAEHPWGKSAKAWGVLGKLGPWGDRLLDVATSDDSPVKWWQVVEFARQNGYDTVPVRYSGPISEIPDSFFEKGYVLGVRFYNEGPWFWPLEQPVVTEAVSEEEATLHSAVDILNAKAGYDT